jgi:hypothetical protein
MTSFSPVDNKNGTLFYNLKRHLLIDRELKLTLTQELAIANLTLSCGTK